MSDPDWPHLQGREAEHAVAWLVRVPSRPDARFVSLDREHALAYAARMHGTVHALAEIVFGEKR